MATGTRFQSPVFTAQDANGDPIPSAQLYFYDNNTTNQKQIYTDIDLTIAQGQPVLADGAGRFVSDMFLSNELYAIELRDGNGVSLWIKNDCGRTGSDAASAFPFVGAVVEFYGTQEQLDTALSSFWYVMDGAYSTPDLNGLFTRACVDVADIGATGGADTITPTGDADSHTLTITEIPEHRHLLFNHLASADTPTSSNHLSIEYIGIGSSAYLLKATDDDADRCLSGVGDGGGQGHTHTLTMDDFDNRPAFYQLIKLLYLGA